MVSKGVDSRKSWVVAMSCFVIQILTFGLTEVSGLFFVATVSTFRTKRELASLPYTLTYCVRSAIGPLIGYLGRRLGIRKVTLIGSILSPLAVGACFFANDIVSLIILWGIVFGFSLGLETSLLNVILNEHFVKHRVKANGLNTAGASIGNMILSPLIEYLVEDVYGLTGTFLIIAGLMLNSIPAVMIIMILNTPKSDAVTSEDLKSPPSDIESALKLRMTLTPANDKEEKTSSSFNIQNKIIPNNTLEEKCREEVFGTVNFGLNSAFILDPCGLNELPVSRNFSKESELNFKCNAVVGRFLVLPVLINHGAQECHGSNPKNLTSVRKFSLAIKTDESNPIVNKLNVANEEDTLDLQTENVGTLSTSSISNKDGKQCNDKVVTFFNLEGSLSDSENSNDPEVANNKTSLCFSGSHYIHTNVSQSNTINHIIGDEKGKDHRKYYCESISTENGQNEITEKNDSSIIPTIKIKNEDDKAILNKTLNSVVKDTNKSDWHVYRLICEPVYVFLLIGSGVYYFSITTFLTIIVDYATDIGLSIAYSTYILIWIGVSDIFGYIVLGYIIERGYLTQSRFATVGFLCMSLTSVAMVWSTNYIILLALVLVFELSQATVIILSAPLVAEYIDEGLQATAMASVTILSAPITLTIPPLIGYFRDIGGSYAGVFYVISSCTFLCSILFFCIPKVKHRKTDQK